MKKYVALVSVLALTACASSGGPDDRFRVSSSSRYFAVGTDAVKSNEQITSMDSEIIVCDEGGCPAHVNRYISNVSHQRSSSGESLYSGTGFKVYGLDNVSFTTSDNPGTEKFKFIIEDSEGSATRGRITHVSMDQGAHILTRQDTQAGNTFANSSDNITLTYNSWADKKLRFSDFGEIKVNDGTEKDYMFAGGYEELKHDQPATNMDFTGNAGGIVSDGTNTQNVNGAATLAFNDGTETLNMNFSGGNVPWYDVQIVKSANVNTITFKNASNVNTNVKFEDFVDGTRTKDFDTNNMNIGYYGPGINVSEATGVVKYTEGDIRMDASFGMKKDIQ